MAKKIVVWDDANKQLGASDTIDWNRVANKPSEYPPEQHASTHAKGGSDELSLDAAQITNGVFDLARIPNIDWVRIQDNFPRYADDLINKVSMQGWLSFDGVDDYVETSATGEDLSSNAGFTWIAIIRPHSVEKDWGVLGWRYTRIGQWGNRFGFILYTQYGDRIAQSSNTIQVGRVYFLAAVWNNVTKEMILWENENKYAGTIESDAYDTQTSYSFDIAKNTHGWYGYGNFSAYLILIYNRALSDEEIQQIYNDPMNPPTDGLVLWLDGSSIDYANGIWYDKSGNGNDGTIYGATPGGFPAKAHTHSIRDVVVNDSVVPNMDNTYDLGSSDGRWKGVYVVNIYTGDVVFQNGWRITEFDSNGVLFDGLRILNEEGAEIMRITEDGLYFKGRKLG